MRFAYTLHVARLQLGFDFVSHHFSNATKRPTQSALLHFSVLEFETAYTFSSETYRQLRRQVSRSIRDLLHSGVAGFHITPPFARAIHSTAGKNHAHKNSSFLVPKHFVNMAMDNINTEKVPVTSTTVASSPHGHTPLQLFQILVGIHTPRSLTQDGCNVERIGTGMSTAQPLYVRSHKGNVGLYQRAKDEERRSRIAYLLTSYISNFLFMLQILLAATFTALSAYKDSNAVTLTVLGALNTVVAG